MAPLEAMGLTVSEAGELESCRKFTMTLRSTLTSSSSSSTSKTKAAAIADGKKTRTLGEFLFVLATS